MRGTWYETNALISCRREFVSSPSVLMVAVFGESQAVPPSQLPKPLLSTVPVAFDSTYETW